jgi:hypothetical protein
MGATIDTTTRPASAKSYTGRIVTIVSLLIGLAGAAAPVALNMDISSSAGIVAGIVAMSAVIVKYLDGWQKYEARIDDQSAPSAAVALVDPNTVAVATAPTPEPAATAPTAPEPPSEEPTPEPDVPPASNLAFINPPTAPAPPSATSAGSDADLVGVADEPDAPLPGALDQPVDPEPGDELGDIPDPPTDEEIAAVEDELSQGLPPARAA